MSTCWSVTLCCLGYWCWSVHNGLTSKTDIYVYTSLLDRLDSVMKHGDLCPLATYYIEGCYCTHCEGRPPCETRLNIRDLETWAVEHVGYGADA